MRQRRAHPAALPPRDADVAIRRKRRGARVGGVPPDVDVASLATRQGGVVSRAQLLELGLSRGEIDRRLRAGRLQALHRGVYAVGHRAIGWKGEATAALLAVGRSSAISHRSAAAAWGMLPTTDGPIVVTVVGRPPRSRPGIAIRETAALDRRDVRRIEAVAVTAPARTLIDLARDGEERLDRAVAEAQVLRLLDRRELAAAMERAVDRRGLAELRRRIEDDGPTRSELERAMLRLVAEAGLPRPLVNRRIGRYTVDFLWERERVVVETDGWHAHAHRSAFESDRARDAHLQASGYVVLRFTWRQIEEARILVASRLAQVLASRA